jgi:N-acetylglucosaminyldiphosphoundecaprenol N-acetyl-beta-D-mannosaminyltransferase
MAIGVGATFSFFAEKVKRAPKRIETRGLEWLWRLMQEPKKLWRRDLIEGPRFLIHVLLEMTGLRKYG